MCPVGGCSSILSSPYAQVGPVPLPALGMLGYGSVAALSAFGLKQRGAAVRREQGRLRGDFFNEADTQRLILAGTALSFVPLLAMALKTHGHAPLAPRPFA